ncbi:hypothetical protein PGT21_004036 [Puccinia graminis f. sp. tritici]|uniref:Uncharacterized protein n=1 Tax=Puccinia graminis f. sp. tritici TaxID=56615 RepID=A0A5B0N394_PUCGR|nr:hypothetical protein PGT21_004036 [Puccinia graminis f. sp. tritici]KAA1133647.1 hypothetical protein PGTUg99_029517 [Puccinia graminis f. sp. tritici]
MPNPDNARPTLPKPFTRESYIRVGKRNMTTPKANNNHVRVHHPRTNSPYPLSLKTISLSCLALFVLEVVLVEAMEFSATAARSAKFADHTPKAGQESSATFLESRTASWSKKPRVENEVRLARGGPSPLAEQHLKNSENQSKLGSSKKLSGIQRFWKKLMRILMAFFKPTKPVKEGQFPKSKIPMKTVPIPGNQKIQLVTIYKGPIFQTQDFIKKDEFNVYRALAHLQYQDQEKHGIVANQIKTYIKENPVQFKKYEILTEDSTRTKKVANQVIDIGGHVYANLKAQENRNVIFSAFSKSQSERLGFSVFTKIPEPHDPNVVKLSGYHYTSIKNERENPRQGLIFENGHYEVFGHSKSAVFVNKVSAEVNHV